MFLIVGLGNPGKDYAGTRHNVGFEAIDKLAFDYNIKVTKFKHRSLLGDGIIAGKKVLLAKPQTYMNLSGESVRDIMEYYKLSGSALIVIYDDVDIPFGSIRIREKGSSGSHNGMKNILYHIESDQFLRIKIGIGNKPDNWDLADFVLSKFSKDEFDVFVRAVTDATDAVYDILLNGASFAMNKFN